MAALARFDEPHLAVRPADCEGQPGDSGSRAQISDRSGRWEDLVQRRGFEQQALRDGERATVTGQIDALAPALEQQRELLPALELTGLSALSNLREASFEDCPQFHVERFHVERACCDGGQTSARLVRLRDPSRGHLPALPRSARGGFYPPLLGRALALAQRFLVLGSTFGHNDDLAEAPFPDAHRGDSVVLANADVDRAAIAAVHRIERDRAAALDRALDHALSEPLEVPLTRIGAALHVEHDAARGLLVALQQQLIRK